MDYIADNINNNNAAQSSEMVADNNNNMNTYKSTIIIVANNIMNRNMNISKNNVNNSINQYNVPVPISDSHTHNVLLGTLYWLIILIMNFGGCTYNNNEYYNG